MKISFNFNLKDVNKNPTSIILIIRRMKKKVKIYTGLTINPNHWNSKRQRVKTQVTNSLEINNELDSQLSYYQELYTHYYLNNPDEVLIDLRKKNKVKFSNLNKNDFFEVFDLFLDYLKSNRAKTTHKRYSTLKRSFESFANYNKIKIEFDDINQNFIDEYISYLVNIRENNNNTINKSIENVIVFFNWSKKRGFHDNNNYNRLNKTKTFVNDIIFLSEEELHRIENLDLSNDIEIEKARDLFLFACHTGQRFSDYNSIDIKDISNNYWTVNQIKGAGRSLVKIPLSTKAKYFIEKYENDIPKFRLSKFNIYAHQIAEKANINEAINKVKYVGSKRIVITKPKYELISSHTARRTFITLSLQKGMQPEAIKKISGHTSDKEFKKYLKIQDSWVNEQFHNAWG